MNVDMVYDQLKSMKDKGFSRVAAVLYVVKTLKLGTLREVEPISRLVAPINKWTERTGSCRNQDQGTNPARGHDNAE